MSDNKKTRQAKVQKKCDKLVKKQRESDHFKAEVQSKKVAWNVIPKTSIVSIDDDIDNILRNYAYHNNIAGSSVLNHLLKNVLGWLIEAFDDIFPQRPKDADWRAYRWYFHEKLMPKVSKLTKAQKKKDEAIKVKLNATYGRNKPCDDCSIWPEERIA